MSPNVYFMKGGIERMDSKATVPGFAFWLQHLLTSCLTVCMSFDSSVFDFLLDSNCTYLIWLL